MDKKIIAAFAGMIAVTTLVAGMMVGCVQINVNNADTKETTRHQEFIVVTLDPGENGEPPETMIIGVEVGVRDDQTTADPTATTGESKKPTTGDSGNTGTTPVVTVPTTPAGPDTSLTYAQYLALGGPGQTAYYQSYFIGAETKEEQDQAVLAFVAWYDAALAEYKKQDQAVEVTGPDINIQDYTKPNP